MLFVQARLSVDPDRIEEFESLARELWDATHRLEPRCRRYEYIRLSEPGHYLTNMVFADHDAFVVHQASDHHRAIAGGPMRELIRSLDIAYGRTVAGAFGAPDVPPPGPLLVDEERRALYAARYPPADFTGWDR
jgi:quinol monooxygenase YgiN